jgi:hypothetical protein
MTTKRKRPAGGQGFGRSATGTSLLAAATLAPLASPASLDHTLAMHCTCHALPSRIGREWATFAGQDLGHGCELHPEHVERFEALQDLLSEVAVLEGGNLVFGVPSRWLAGLVRRFRCTSGHVSASDDPQTIVAGACPECLAPLALTFPEDVSDGCR